MISKKASRTFLASRWVGSKIKLRVGLTRHSSKHAPVFEELSKRIVGYLESNHMIVSYTDVGGSTKGAKITYFDSSLSVRFHEQWHKLVWKSGFHKRVAVGYAGIEESMATAISDWKLRLCPDIGKRINVRRYNGGKMFPICRDVVDACNVGGVSDKRHTTIVNFARETSKTSTPHNWSAFLHGMHYLGMYSVCSRILQENGTRRGQEVFLKAIDLMEKYDDPLAGVEVLMGVDPSPEFDYCEFWTNYCVDGLGTEETNTVCIQGPMKFLVFCRKRRLYEGLRDVYGSVVKT